MNLEETFQWMLVDTRQWVLEETIAVPIYLCQNRLCVLEPQLETSQVVSACCVWGAFPTILKQGTNQAVRMPLQAR